MKYHKILQPEEISIREKEDAMGSYLMMFAALAIGLPFPSLNLIAAVIYYFINRSKGRFVHFHILQSLYSQIPTSLLNIGFVAWIIRMIVNDNFHFSDFFLGYLLLTATVNLTYIVFSIIAAVKARKGQMYYFMVIGELAFKQAYKMTKNTETKNPENKAPKSLTEIH